MEEKINVVVTDDHNLFRKGMCALLSDFEFIDEIYEAGNGVELLRLLWSGNGKPDLVLLDMRMPEMDGMEAADQLKQHFPDLKIIILTMEDDAQMVLHMIEKGVNGYLLKNADPDELELAIKKVIKNDYYFTGGISEMLLKYDKGIKEAKAIDLTQREKEVLELVCKELTAVEIGEELSISARTVEGYKRKLLEKTGTKNMAGLVIFAIKNKLISV